MRGRGNMAAVTLLNLLVCWIGIFAEANAARGSSSSPSKSVQLPLSQQQQHEVLGKAVEWLWSKRDKDAGWGNDTHRVLLALRLANLSRDDNVPPPASLDMLLSTKQMELEIVTLLWRHREMGSSAMRLARYALALNAMCMDPRQFHGHDLIGTVQHHEPPSDYEFALSALAACNAQAHMRKRHMRRLLDITHTAQHHSVETVAMGVMTLHCIVQDHRHRNLQHFVRKPSTNLAQRQRRDGGFGELRTTAVAMQALEEPENEPIANWNRSATLAWLAARQRQDGSFDADVRTTAEVVLGLAPRKPPSIRTLDCAAVAPRAVQESQLHRTWSTTSSPSLQPTGSAASSPSSSSLTAEAAAAAVATTATTTTTPISSDEKEDDEDEDDNDDDDDDDDDDEEEEEEEKQGQEEVIVPKEKIKQKKQRGKKVVVVLVEKSTLPSAYIIGGRQAPMVNVTYTLWVGSDVKEIYNLTISAPKNETFYEVMVVAAQRSSNFHFSAYDWPNGHYVHTLAGYKEEPMSYHYWLLYRLSSPPNPKSPPGNTLVAPGGVDDLQISNGEHYLFWYKKL